MTPAPFDSARLGFRRPDATDLAPYAAYCASARTVHVGGPYDPVQAFEKLAAMIGHWTLRGFGRYVFFDKDTNRALGHVGALQLDLQSPPEMTWTLWHGGDEGRGIATEACTAYLNHAVRVALCPHLIARIAPDNLRSRRLADRLGGQLDVDATPPAWLPNALCYRLSLDDPAIR